MKDEIRKSILTGERDPNGQCVICNRKVCKNNHFLCQEHHNEELQATFALIAKGVLGIIAHYYPKGEKEVEKYKLDSDFSRIQATDRYTVINNNK